MGGRFLRRLARDRAGNTLLIFAASLVPLMLIVGSGLDLGVRYMAQAKLQNACDAGVLAGRQFMQGNAWNAAAEAEAERFFAFNFPEGTNGVIGADFQVRPNPANAAEILGHVEGEVPTSLMRIGGIETLSVAADCDATRDQGHNDVMLVLDVTGSMAAAPTSGGGTKIGRLRTGAIGLYRALADDANGSITRFGIVPYSHTVNTARVMRDDDILINQTYVKRSQQCSGRTCWYVYGTKTVPINSSSWRILYESDLQKMIDRFRTSGNGCIEERPSVGNSYSPFHIQPSVSRADVDAIAADSSETLLQFGRYDPAIQEGQSQSGCPSEATRLQTYVDEAAYQADINAATARVTGGTYHDVGMLWGLRFISRTGRFASLNPTQINGIPVNQHIVFMTDGMLDTGDTLYSSHGVERYQQRTASPGTLDARHIARFKQACQLAKSMKITVWVIALDVTSTADVASCATSPGHFFVSNGSDLESVFERIGQGIGNLRLTQ